MQLWFYKRLCQTLFIHIKNQCFCFLLSLSFHPMSTPQSGVRSKNNKRSKKKKKRNCTRDKKKEESLIKTVTLNSTAVLGTCSFSFCVYVGQQRLVWRETQRKKVMDNIQSLCSVCCKTKVFFLFFISRAIPEHR